jgi:hypothetical protein
MEQAAPQIRDSRDLLDFSSALTVLFFLLAVYRDAVLLEPQFIQPRLATNHSQRASIKLTTRLISSLAFEIRLNSKADNTRDLRRSPRAAEIRSQ